MNAIGNVYSWKYRRYRRCIWKEKTMCEKHIGDISDMFGTYVVFAMWEFHISEISAICLGRMESMGVSNVSINICRSFTYRRYRRYVWGVRRVYSRRRIFLKSPQSMLIPGPGYAYLRVNSVCSLRGSFTYRRYRRYVCVLLELTAVILH